MYKNTKYNLITIILVIIMGVFLGAYGIVSPSLYMPADADNSIENPSSDNGNGPIEEMPIGKFTPPSATANEFTRIDFALKALNQGDGFYSESKQEIKSMGQTQNIFSKAYRSKNYNFLEEWQYATLAMAKNQFVIFYDDGANTQIKTITDRGKFTTSPFTYQDDYPGEKQTFNSKEFEGKYNNFNNFPITVNSKTSTVQTYDKRSDKNNYIITVSVNISRIDRSYIDFFEFNGTDNLVFSSVVITFKINKKTGFLTEIIKRENFKTTYAGISASCESVGVQKFLKVNTSVESQIVELANKNFNN